MRNNNRIASEALERTNSSAGLGSEKEPNSKINNMEGIIVEDIDSIIEKILENSSRIFTLFATIGDLDECDQTREIANMLEKLETKLQDIEVISMEDLVASNVIFLPLFDFFKFLLGIDEKLKFIFEQKYEVRESDYRYNIACYSIQSNGVFFVTCLPRTYSQAGIRKFIDILRGSIIVKPKSKFSKDEIEYIRHKVEKRLKEHYFEAYVLRLLSSESEFYVFLPDYDTWRILRSLNFTLRELLEKPDSVIQSLAHTLDRNFGIKVKKDNIVKFYRDPEKECVKLYIDGDHYDLCGKIFDPPMHIVRLNIENLSLIADLLERHGSPQLAETTLREVSNILGINPIEYTNSPLPKIFSVCAFYKKGMTGELFIPIKLLEINYTYENTETLCLELEFEGIIIEFPTLYATYVDWDSLNRHLDEISTLFENSKQSENHRDIGRINVGFVFKIGSKPKLREIRAQYYESSDSPSSDIVYRHHNIFLRFDDFNQLRDWIWGIVNIANIQDFREEYLEYDTTYADVIAFGSAFVWRFLHKIFEYKIEKTVNIETLSRRLDLEPKDLIEVIRSSDILKEVMKYIEEADVIVFNKSKLEKLRKNLDRIKEEKIEYYKKLIFERINKYIPYRIIHWRGGEVHKWVPYFRF